MRWRVGCRHISHLVSCVAVNLRAFYKFITAISLTSTYRAYLLSLRATEKVSRDMKTKGKDFAIYVLVCKFPCVFFLGDVSCEMVIILNKKEETKRSQPNSQS